MVCLIVNIGWLWRNDDTMWPKVGPIYTYGLLYLAGIVCHFFMTGHLRKQLGVRRHIQVLASVLYMIAMTFGAKLLYDIHESQFSFRGLFSSRHYLEGGLWGGLLAYLILAAPFVLFFARKKAAALDLVALSIPIPWIFTKVGCLLNGCCYGIPCTLPWAITFPEGVSAPAGTPLHPVQLYEIASMLGIYLALRWLSKRTPPGRLLLWFIALYGLARTLTDFWRGDTDRYIYLGPATVTQIVCLAGALLALFLLWLIRRICRVRL